VIELYRESAAEIVEGERLIESSMSDPQIIERAERGTGEVAQFRMVALALQLTDDGDRDHYAMFSESIDGTRVCQEHTCIKDVGDARLCCQSLPRDVQIEATWPITRKR
jgi:hypothetical protein